MAKEEGYDLILNTVDGSGTSIVLHVQPERDLTERVLKRLGIELPQG